jgi:Uma2 family endonuclease
MAAHPIPELLTLDEYLRSSFHPDLEFVDDHVEEKHMGTIPHSLLQAELVFWFRSRRAKWKIRVLPEVRTRTRPARVRLPDVAVVRDDDNLREQVRSTSPLIVIEILSPEDRWKRVIPRLEEFAVMGAEHIWILDPIDRAAYTYADHGVKLVQEPRLALPDSPIYLDLPEIFAALD